MGIVHRSVTPLPGRSELNSPGGDEQCESKVPCPRTPHNAPGTLSAHLRTALSGVDAITMKSSCFHTHPTLSSTNFPKIRAKWCCTFWVVMQNEINVKAMISSNQWTWWSKVRVTQYDPLQWRMISFFSGSQRKLRTTQLPINWLQKRQSSASEIKMAFSSCPPIPWLAGLLM